MSKFRKGTRVLVIVDRAESGYDVVNAIYERSFGSCYHQARKEDGGIIQGRYQKMLIAS